MRLQYYVLAIALCVHGTTSAVVRKPPAFATPTFTDAILPAGLQAIFHIVGQLRALEAEEIERNQSMTEPTSPHPPGQKQPLPTTQPTIVTVEEIGTLTITDEERYYIPPERYQEEALIISKPEGDIEYEKIGNGQVTPEVNHEISEIAYGVPEKNYEIPEANHELPEETQLNVSEESENDETGKTDICDEFDTSSEIDPNDSTTSVEVDSVVKEIYSIINKTSSSLKKENGPSPSSKDSKNRKCIEGKNSPVKNIMAEKLSEENKERLDELKDDERFTLLGERVEQVPRPSLFAFLRASNATSNPSLTHLSKLYDALSKDARSQGYSKYSGYSEKALKYLHDTAGGGAGVQLRILLEKMLENKELTRPDAMEKAMETIAILKDQGSQLSTELRQIFPLTFDA